MGLKDGILYEGTIDVAVSTIIPQGLTKHVQVDAMNRFKASNSVIMQLTSADISASIVWSLEVSADGISWDVARDGVGDNVTGTLVVNEPYVDVFRATDGLWYRISLAVTTETGNVTYLLKDGSR